VADGAALRIALLARAGDAREQLKRAVSDLGAQIVVEADPNDLAPGALADSGATTVLVSVEPAVEAALDRLDAELMAPSLNVMFDEADTTAKLSGWDLNRWARHLAAKLVGCDVLPPGAEPEAHQEAAEHLVPGVPTTPAAMASEARIADFADEISASAADVPSAERLSDAPHAPEPESAAAPAEPAVVAAWVTPPADEGDPEHLDLDLAALEQALQPVSPPGEAAARAFDATIASDAPAAFAVADDLDVGMIDLRGLELVDDADLAEAPRPPQSSVSLLSAKEITLDGGFDADFGDAVLASSPVTPGDALAMDVEELTLTDEELAAFGEGPLAGLAETREVATGPRRAEPADELAMDDDFARLAASFDKNLDALSFEGAADAEADEFAGFDRREAPLAMGERSDAPLEPARPASEPPPVPDFDFAEGAYVEASKPAPVALPDTGGLRLAGDDEALPPALAKASKAAVRGFSSLSGLELAPLDDAPAAAPAPVDPPVAAPVIAIDHLGLSLLTDEDVAAAAAASRIVLVLSGIGGPDAVRQIVRALPAGFPLAVLLQQNLDGGRHDRFVEQLGKISRLPVALADSAETPPPNAVRVLPEGLSSAGALSFPKAGGVAALIAAATAQDGAVVVLSGADEAAIEPLTKAMAQGTRVLVQEPSSCFDAKVASALQAAGAPSVPAADLAARLDAYFPT
jgi:chemotaxis response regulator CheB